MSMTMNMAMAMMKYLGEGGGECIDGGADTARIRRRRNRRKRRRLLGGGEEMVDENECHNDGDDVDDHGLYSYSTSHRHGY
mmetsp:Transcript_14817/g.36235  ORF Transcript_14817/g.36235 Transcript_14817/m.36235 type:complete len:81 (+) Transcript_14817:234-476(+)